MNEYFIPCNQQSLYWVVKEWYPPAIKNTKYFRFLTFDEANKYAEQLSGIKRENAVKKNNGFLRYTRGIGVRESIPPFEIAKRIKTNTDLNYIDIKDVFSFLRNQVFNIPDAPENLILKLLEQTEPICRENLILDYKLKNLNLFPELADMIRVKNDK